MQTRSCVNPRVTQADMFNKGSSGLWDAIKKRTRRTGIVGPAIVVIAIIITIVLWVLVLTK
jgi:hypothetical protein